MAQFDLDSADGVQNVLDSINTSAVSTTIVATTTAQVVKVGGSNLVDRKYVFIEALGTNVKWGFTTSCLFNAFKNQNIWIPVGPSVNIYIKTTTSTASVSVAEAS